MPIVNYVWFSPTMFSDAPTPAICFIDVDPVVAESVYQLFARVDLTTANGSCAAEPPVYVPVPPGAGGPGPHVTVISHTPTTVEPVTEEEPASTPTSTPTPEPSASPTDEPDDVVAPPTTTAPDLTWLFWLCGFLALLILAGGAVYIFRRRR